MAEVWLAHDDTLGRRVAVKLLAEHLARDEELRARFLREARLAARLSHPNVVQVFDSGERDGRPFIVMEHVQGTSLADELRRRGPLPPTEVEALALQACAGLQHAHDAGLVHRDVKPHNLLLRADGTLKIADFGIARLAEEPSITQAGTVLGTAAYLAPEVTAGEPATPASDLYSLGAVLYELLAGSPPRRTGALDGLLRLREPVPPPRAPAALRDAVARCLASDPRDRPASAAAVAAALSGGPPPEARTRVLRRRRRPPVALLAAAATAIAIGLGAALAASPGGEGPPARATTVVETIPSGGDPAADARALAAWLRRTAR